MTTIQAIFYADPDRYPPIINQSRFFSEQGYQYDMLCREMGERWGVQYPGSVRVRRLQPARGGSWWAYVTFALQVVLQCDPTAKCVLAHDMHALFPAWLISRRQRLPLIYQIHELYDETSPLSLGGLCVYRFHKRIARKANLVIAPDSDRAAVLVDHLQLTQPVLVVCNSPSERTAVGGTRLHQALGERKYSFERIVLRQSSVGPGHALENTIRSIQYWADPRWGFVVVGPGPNGYRESLRRLAAELGVQDRVVILPPVSYDDVFLYTGGADVGHSLYEPVDINSRISTTSSNKLMEYMAAGVPLLVSDRPALRRFVEKYRCGVTADESSPERIAAAINDLLGNAPRARHMGEAGRAAFVQEFCYERQFQPLLNATRALCGQA